MSDAILVLNAGSSSLKFSVFPGHENPTRQAIICEGEFEGFGHRVHFMAKDRAGAPLVDEYRAEGTTHEDALAALLRWLEDHFAEHQLVAAGHRVVHGGSLYTAPVLIDASVTAGLRRLIPLAPLHQPHNLAAIDVLSKLHPALPQVACFDTAFHHTQSEIATAFALPRRLAAEGIRRYGFHGLSYEYIAGVLPDILGAAAADGRVVVAHLGSGASLCAIRNRRSVATTMGFTALDGLAMSRRCGNLDPGVVLYLMQEKGMTATEVSHLLYNESGLFGVSGISDDMRTLLASGDPSAEQAVALFVYRIGRELGSMAAALGGIDALVFTAGIGEHAAEIRRRVCADAAWLGVDLDQGANAAGDVRITHPGSQTSAWVIPTDEDLMIALHTCVECRRCATRFAPKQWKPASMTGSENSSLPSVPAFWPMAMAATMLKQGTELYAKNLKFVEEEIKIHGELRPALATPNQARLDLRTMVLRDYGKPVGIPTLIDAPHAGHTAMIADYYKGQSLVQTLLANGVGHVALTDWKPASADMKDLEVDNYLAEVLVAIDDLGGRVNLVGLCQGGWMSAMIAARFPDKVNSLVLAGAPIDTDAGNGSIKRMVHQSPASFYEELVALGGGLMKGKFMLQGWKNMHPGQHYIQDHVDLYEHIDDPGYLVKEETFESWYENPIDLPGRWYLQVINQIFKENRLARGAFIGLGRRLDLHDITCPVYLLAGADDDITTPEQVLNAAQLIGTAQDHIVQEVVPGGHIGLFMGANTLRDHWPRIAGWMAAQ